MDFISKGLTCVTRVIWLSATSLGTNLALNGRTFYMKSQPDRSTFLTRPRPGARRPRGRRGFSLVELLAVIAIIAIIFVIGGGEIARAWKRQKLQSASTDIRVLFQRAYAEAQRRGTAVFVQVGPLVVAGASRSLPIYLVGDRTQDEVLNAFQRVPVAGEDLLIDQYNIVVTGLSGTMGISGVNQEFCLSDTNTAQVISTLWSDENPGPGTTDWTVPRVLMCDLQGRTMSVAPKAGLPTSNGRQIGQPATLVLTHVDTVSGDLMPLTRYVFSISPVWSVRVIKQIRDTSNVWVSQNG